MNACISTDVRPAIFLDGVYSACPLSGFVLWRSSPADQIVVIKIRERQHSHYLTPLASLLLYPILLLYMCPKSLLFHLSLYHFSSTSSSFLLTPPFPWFALLLLLLLLRSLSQGPRVPVCNISKAVRRPGQGKQPSAGFRGDGGRDVFLRNPGTPKGFWLKPGVGWQGKAIPSFAPTQEHIMFRRFFLLFLLCDFFLLSAFFLYTFYASFSESVYKNLNTCTMTYPHITLRLTGFFVTMCHYSLAIMLPYPSIHLFCRYSPGFWYVQLVKLANSSDKNKNIIIIDGPWVKVIINLPFVITFSQWGSHRHYW